MKLFRRVFLKDCSLMVFGIVLLFIIVFLEKDNCGRIECMLVKLLEINDDVVDCLLEL